jgi:hypothetical protein
VFDLPCRLERDTVADRSGALAEAAAASLGFRRGTGDWRTLVAGRSPEPFGFRKGLRIQSLVEAILGLEPRLGLDGVPAG